VPHVGTHGIRHRAATDIANSGVSVKVGMALTAHKTAAMFMRYVHAEDDPIRAAAEKVARVRKEAIKDMNEGSSNVSTLPSDIPASLATPAGRTSLGNYRPFRHRKPANPRHTAWSETYGRWLN
jgi:Phage integrase family.